MRRPAILTLTILALLAILGLSTGQAEDQGRGDACVLPKLTIARLDNPLPSWHRLVVGGLNPFPNSDAVAFGQIVLRDKADKPIARAAFFIDWAAGSAIDIIVPVNCDRPWSIASLEIKGCYPVENQNDEN